MRTALWRAFLAVIVAATLAVAPAAAWGLDDTFGFTVDTARLADDHRTVVVGGTYTCGPFDTTTAGVVDLTVRQGRTTGFGYVPILTCDGTAQPYQAEVVSNSDRRFKGDAASVTASGYAQGVFGGESFTQTTRVDNQRITIRRR